MLDGTVRVKCVGIKKALNCVLQQIALRLQCEVIVNSNCLSEPEILSKKLAQNFDGNGHHVSSAKE